MTQNLTRLIYSGRNLDPTTQDQTVKDKNEEIVLIVKQSISYEIREFSSKSSLAHTFADDSILDSNIISVIGENGLSAVSSIFIAIEKFIDEMPKRQKKETEGDD